MFERIRLAVYDIVKKQLDPTDHVSFTIDDVYIRKCDRTLQNWYCNISTNLPDGMVYECTYNGDKDELYIDSYKRINNECLKDFSKEQTISDPSLITSKMTDVIAIK